MIHINTCSFCDCMHSTSQIINILRGDSCHRNTPIFGQINTEVLRYFFNLKNTYWIRIVKTYLFIIDMGPCDLNGIAPKGRHIRILVTCSGFMPVKQNIPIWSVICSQLCVDPSRIKPSFNFLRIVIIRSAITLTSPSLKVEEYIAFFRFCYTLDGGEYYEMWALHIHGLPFGSQLRVRQNCRN